MNTYLLGLIFSLVLSQAVAELLGVQIYRQPLRLLAAVIPVFVAFTMWDVFAITRGHWSFGPGILPVRVLGILPVEEILFFLVIPYCSVNTYECFCELRGRSVLP